MNQTLIAQSQDLVPGIEEAGENPALYPKLYALEAVVRDVSRSLGKPEKAGRQTSFFAERRIAELREPED